VAGSNKKDHSIRAMFDGIAHRYDLLNQVLSFGVHRIWQRRLVDKVLKTKPAKIIDVATGTAGVAIALAKKDQSVSIVGVDIAENMLSMGALKVNKQGLQERIKLVNAYAEELPFEDNTFNSATVAYGVRNFDDPIKGLKEMYRVIVPGGNINVLEFVNPRLLLFRSIYGLYFKRVLPFIGRLISGHHQAYTYLPKSVNEFAERQDFIEMLLKVGFVEANFSIQSVGIAAIYTASKPLKDK